MTIRHINSLWHTRVDLHLHWVRFIVLQNRMLVEGLTHLIYMQVHNLQIYQCGNLSHM